MSIPSSELEATLTRSRSGARSSRRTSLHDGWLESATGVGLSDASGASPSAADDADATPSVADQYAALQPQFPAALEVVPSKPAFGIFKRLNDEQRALKAAIDSYESQIGAADPTAAAALLKGVTDLLPGTAATQRTAKLKFAYHDEKGRVGDRPMKALVAVPGAPDWLTQAQTDLSTSETDYSNRFMAADAPTHRQLVDGYLAKLDGAERAMTKMVKVIRPATAIRPAADQALVDMNAGDAVLKPLKIKLKAAVDRYDRGIAAADLSSATALAQDVSATLADVTTARLTGGGKPKPGDLRKTVTAAFATDPAVFKVLAGNAEGCQLLDAMVADVGGSAKDAASKEFVKQALMARFGIDKLEGDLTTKALPRLYDVMRKLPAAHTKDNARLKDIERHRKSGEGASWYSEAKDGMVLNLERTGKFRGETEMLNGKKVSSFDTTTLHEIGHSVDSRFKFMSSHVGVGAFGGWDKTTLDKVVDVAGSTALLGASQPFFVQFATLPRAFLQGYLKQALRGQEAVVGPAASATAADFSQDPALAEAATLFAANKNAENKIPDLTRIKLIAQAMKKARIKDKDKRAILLKMVTRILEGSKQDTVVQAFLDACKIEQAPGTVDWQALAAHPAIAWCQGVRMKGENNGLWDAGTAGATRYAVGGATVYQESYKDQWVTYSLSARANGVSTYQFRADGEWFAEIYAAYYQDLLKPSHPDAKWFKPEVHDRAA